LSHWSLLVVNFDQNKKSFVVAALLAAGLLPYKKKKETSS
jgi:hypothetical protein